MIPTLVFGNLSKKSDDGEGLDNLTEFLVILADKETGETINRLVKLRKRNFGHKYKLYVKNKGGWIF